MLLIWWLSLLVHVVAVVVGVGVYGFVALGVVDVALCEFGVSVDVVVIDAGPAVVGVC